MNSRILRLGALLVSGTWCGVAAEGWRSEAPLPRPLAGPAAASTRAGVWIAGGSWWEGQTKQVGTAVYHRAPGQDAWSTVGDLAEGFAHGGFATDGDTLWLAGGLARDGVSASVRRLDLTTGHVTESARLGGPRVHCGATTMAGALWVLGGTPAEGDPARADGAAWRIDLATGAVTQLPPGPAWINPVVLALDGRLHVLPGGVWSAARGRLEAPERIQIYHPLERRWESRPLARPLPRGLAGVALDERRAVLAGGFELGPGIPAIARVTWLYRGDLGTLDPLPPLPAPRLAAVALRTADDVLVIGGEDRPRGRAATVWRLAGKELP